MNDPLIERVTCPSNHIHISHFYSINKQKSTTRIKETQGEEFFLSLFKSHGGDTHPDNYGR